MTKPSKAYKTMPDVICPTCGHVQPKLSRYPFPADFQLHWNQLQFIERRLLAACIVDHLRQPFREWGPMFMSNFGHMKYRMVLNACRRLVPCGWLQRVSRGVYRLTPHAVASLSWVKPSWQQNKIYNTEEAPGTAQAPGTEDKDT